MARPSNRPPGDFRKPDYWDSSPAPKPARAEQAQDDPEGLSPTRYGDWVKNGIAADF